jgi:glycogen synthase
LFQAFRDGTRWVLVASDGFFDAAGGPHGDNPYDHSSPEKPDVFSDPLLLRDGLFGSAAIPSALAKLGLTENLVVHVQDWQLAPTVLTVKEAILDGVLKSAAVVLTSHNPYDFGLGPHDLALISRRTRDNQWLRPPESALRPSDSRSPRGVSERRRTVYEHMIPLFDAPVSTVSRQYAVDLTSHPLQTGHFAEHLQQVFFRQGLVGINNGLFMRPRRAFTADAVVKAREGDPEPILAEKLAKRRVMLKVLSHYRPPQAFGYLQGGSGWDLTELPDEVPVFMMFGRLDPGQKGFDVLSRAIGKIRPGTAKFILCPVVPARVEPFRDDLRDLACTRPGDVVVFPFQMQQGYIESMAGASYCVMPSLHEPFGAATEPYLQGTPVVAHATGGLIQQVVDWHACPQRATGFLFRAQAELQAEQTEQGRLAAGVQWHDIQRAETPAARMTCPLYVSLVNALTYALEDAIRLYQADVVGYGRVLANLHEQAVQFTWEQAAAEYNALYDLASEA